MTDEIAIENLEVDGWFYTMNGWEQGRVRVSVYESDLPESYRSNSEIMAQLLELSRLVKEHLERCHGR